MSNREVMIAYYEAHPDEAPPQATAVIQTSKPKSEPIKEVRAKKVLRRNDLLLAGGVAFAVTFIVIAVLYVLGAFM